MFSFGTIKLGKIFGFEVELDYSWFLIFFLVTLNFTLNFFHEYNFSLVVSIVDGLLTAVLFFSSVIFHELCHCLIARFNKLPIKKITLFLFGGVAQMAEEPKSPRVEFKMAIAGPLSSLFLALVFWIIYTFLNTFTLSDAIVTPFYWLALINLWLGLFNLAPGFPLDGGRILRAALWSWYKNVERATKIASQFGQGFAFLLIAVGVFTVFLGYLGGVWFIILGLFLNRIAQSSYQQLLLQKYLSGIKISAIMSRDVLTVSSNISLELLVDEYFLKHKFGRFPVIDGEKLVGIITLHQV
ncbi:MAG: site-2 protease family protein, partial [Candidatus Subteraquimicrobiales bacterium]|nr:site-2 protease family protein [Candidatus Subteraquimicrobiales bacterium]